MSKTKEHILFVLIFLFVFTIGSMGFNLLLHEEESFSEILMRSAFVVFILLIFRLFGFGYRKGK